MSLTIVVGLDGEETGGRAVAYARKIARLTEGATIVAAYVIEWSPYSFQTAEENAQRHKRREEEIATAKSRVVEPVIAELQRDGFGASGRVMHGDVAECLNRTALEEGADMIIVARTNEGGLARRFFGSSVSSLVMDASVPVTVVN